MSGTQVQLFIPLLCRPDTTQLGAGIQAPTSSPAHRAQLAASVTAGGGDKDLVMVVLDTLCHSNLSPWPLPGLCQQELGQMPWVRGNYLSQG